MWIHAGFYDKDTGAYNKERMHNVTKRMFKKPESAEEKLKDYEKCHDERKKLFYLRMAVDHNSLVVH